MSISEPQTAKELHERLLGPRRYNPDGSSRKGRNLTQEAESDRARVIYSSAFRRMQHKTQVFTLSKDAAVRTRLTHSLEVASVGRLIAQSVVRTLADAGLDSDRCSAMVALVETACLAHDIGNPPFGHFGEAAIKQWFRDNWKEITGCVQAYAKLEQLAEDFLQFDGNAQGIRILTRLQGRTEEERQKYGMDLLYSQILTALKYPRGPLDQRNSWKKAGFFESERLKINHAWEALDFKVQQRFPLAYLVEAADDISYCMGDMEDGIDQGILTPDAFFSEIQVWVEKVNPRPELKMLRDEARESFRKIRSMTNREEEKEQKEPDEKLPPRHKDLFVKFKTDFTTAMIGEAARAYGDGTAEDIQKGTRGELLQNTDAKELLDVLRETARRYLYPADKVQQPFLAGLKVTHGILEAYSRILKLPMGQFKMVRDSWRSKNRGRIAAERLETLLPILDRLPSHYLDVYDSSVEKDAAPADCPSDVWEWFCRAHLIVDYLSGMTDDYAFRTYQIISGAQLE